MNAKFTSLLFVCNFILLTWKGLLHFTSSQPYNQLFEVNEVFIQFFGLILLISGFLCALPFDLLKFGKLKFLFLASSWILIFQSMASMVANEWVIEQFVEHTLQMILPLALYYRLLGDRGRRRNWKEIIQVALAMTFIGHGLFAVGAHFVPENFIEMVTQITGLSLVPAKQFLFAMGILDFVAAIFMFVPFLQKSALWYMLIWGICTALARPISQIGSFDQIDFYTVHLSNGIYRLVHGLIPFYFLAKIYGWRFATPSYVRKMASTRV